eukprot:CAMPEP_0182468558 /NCGR_PEP_ID=MMETSP1319-20130603/15693_1 /TAXON_ID=172717 /ORGANISM="Bolidomonas pacifica, Strain RCC208" /LENGTH=357 /DNA_ID=CAMNT_0024668771 /DNA_START=214 /DNA_END=1284 /DNA_ORIENTATION=-
MVYKATVTLSPPAYAAKTSAVQTRFSADGTYVLAGHSDSTVSIYNARQDSASPKDPIASYGTSANTSLSCLTVSPSSETFVTAGLTPAHSPSSILLYSVQKSVQTTDLKGNNSGNINVTTISSPNGHTPAPRHLAIPSISSTAFSANEKVLLSAGFDGKVVVWDLQSSGRAYKISNCSNLSPKPGDSLNFVSFASKSDDKIIVTSSSSGAITFYDMRNCGRPLGSCRTQVNIQGAPIVTNVVYRDGMCWACCLDGVVRCFDFQASKPVDDGAATTPDGAEGGGSFLKVIKTYHGSHKAASYSAMTCDVAPNLKRVVVGSEDERGAAVYDVESMEVVQNVGTGSALPYVEFAKKEDWI